MITYSEMLKSLIENNLIWLGILETIYMTVVSSIISYIIGLPLGVILNITSEDGLTPNRLINKTLGAIINLFRSIPFIILMVAMLPVAKLIVGTSLGNNAMIVMLVIAASPYIARMVESSLKEIDYGKIEAAKSMGATDIQIIFKVILGESIPSLIIGAVISTVTILGYSAMASTIGGTGLGQIAIIYGHQRSNPDITWLSVLLMVLIVQVIQEVGLFISRKIDRRTLKSRNN